MPYTMRPHVIQSQLPLLIHLCYSTPPPPLQPTRLLAGWRHARDALPWCLEASPQMVTWLLSQSFKFLLKCHLCTLMSAPPWPPYLNFSPPPQSSQSPLPWSTVPFYHRTYHLQVHYTICLLLRAHFHVCLAHGNVTHVHSCIPTI